MTISNLPIYYSRSAVSQYWRCPRSRYWGYEYLGRGLSSNTIAIELFLGIVAHDAIAAMAHGIDIDLIATAAATQVRDELLQANRGDAAETFALEQSCLMEGLIRGFHRHVWPRLQKDYPEIVHIEEEVTYEHDGLTFLSKPDIILRDGEGQLWIPEWKTTSSVKDQWINSWGTAVQVHAQIKAAERTLGEKVIGVLVIGLNKGYASYGRQNSPFCYSYRRAGTPPFIADDFRYDYKAGYKAYPVWEMAGGVKQWVAEMPIETLSAQFPMVPPIFVKDYLIDGFFRQSATRERAIRVARDRIMADGCGEDERTHLLDDVFPQNFEACKPSFGHGCNFVSLCHGVVDDPLKMGYRPRTSHHEREEEQLNANT